jgi:hypothetical protein
MVRRGTAWVLGSRFLAFLGFAMLEVAANGRGRGARGLVVAGMIANASAWLVVTNSMFSLMMSVLNYMCGV